MRFAWLFALIAGCGFTSSPVDEDPIGEPGEPAPPGGGSGGAGGTAPRCDVNDSLLRLCLTFDSPTVQDLVEPPHALAETSGIQILRILSNATAKLDGSARIRFMPSTDFVVPELTLDLWIDPDKLPKNQNLATMLSQDRSYFTAYQEDGHVQCGIGDERVTSAVAITSNWHHVACRYEAARRELRVYVDGSVSGCTQVSNGIPMGSGEVAVGASYSASRYQNSYVGSLDSLHLYGRALSDAELCHAAHRTSCNTRCPDSGGRDPRDAE